MSTKSSTRALKTINASKAPAENRESKKDAAKRIAEENAIKAQAAEVLRLDELAKAEATQKSTEGAPIVAPVKVQVVRDAFGNRLATRAHAINAILLTADKALRASEIETLVQTSELGRAYALAHNKQIGAVRNHLQALLSLKLVTLDKGAWRAIEDATKAQRLLQIAAEAEASLQAQANK